MKRYKGRLLTSLIVILVPVAILVAFLLLFFTTGTIGSWCASQEWSAIHEEVATYVLENKVSIPISNPDQDQTFVYTTGGSWDTYLEFGYYYSSDDTYHYVKPVKENKYKKGYRAYGIPNDKHDWYYTAKLCEHWYYYELHDG